MAAAMQAELEPIRQALQAGIAQCRQGHVSNARNRKLKDVESKLNEFYAGVTAARVRHGLWLESTDWIVEHSLIHLDHFVCAL